MATPESPRWLDSLSADAGAASGDAKASIAVAQKYGHLLPLPGSGATSQRWATLQSLGRTDLTAARVVEAHTDALAILAEAGQGPLEGSWGVFAAESPEARLDASCSDGRWQLSGTKPWCSVAGLLDRALVTAHVPGGRQLFAVDLAAAGVHIEPPTEWIARGLHDVPSGPVSFDQTSAEPIGERDWYLHRTGFAWGGIGVAACWLGGAEGLMPFLDARLEQRPGDALAQLAVGRADAALYGARCALEAAAREVDGGYLDDDCSAGSGSSPSPELLAFRCRAVVAEAVEAVMQIAAHALGPAPLAFDESYARRMADLQLYVRQHHAERDLAALGNARAQRSRP